MRTPDFTPDPARLRQLRELHPPEQGGATPEPTPTSNGFSAPAAPDAGTNDQMTVTSVVRVPMSVVQSMLDDSARRLLEGWVKVYVEANVPGAVAVYALDLLREQFIAKERARLGIPTVRPTE